MRAHLVPAPLRRFVPLVERWSPGVCEEDAWEFAEQAEKRPEVIKKLEEFAASWTGEVAESFHVWGVATDMGAECAEYERFANLFNLLDCLRINVPDWPPDPIERHLRDLRTLGSAVWAIARRRYAAHSLTEYGDDAKRAIPALHDATRDSDPTVCAWAHTALALLDGDRESHGAAIREIETSLSQVVGESEFLTRREELMAQMNVSHAQAALNYLNQTQEWRDVQALGMAAKRGDLRSLRRLLKIVPADSQDKDGGRALGCAIGEGEVEAAKLLLEAGANPNPRDRHGKTALHWLVTHRNQAELIRLLLARGADPALRDDEGRTPADIAREFDREDYLPLLENRL